VKIYLERCGVAVAADFTFERPADLEPKRSLSFEVRSLLNKFSASPSDGPPALPLLPGYTAWYDAGPTPRRATSPPGRAPPPDLVALTGAPRVRSASAPEPAPTKNEKCRHGTRIGYVLGIGASTAGSDIRPQTLFSSIKLPAAPDVLFQVGRYVTGTAGR
jgi:hypothetical protein